MLFLDLKFVKILRDIRITIIVVRALNILTTVLHKIKTQNSQHLAPRPPQPRLWIR